MSNLTISIDDQLIKQARVRAIQQGTSLSAKVREFLQAYVNGSDDMLAKQRFDATASLMVAIELATPPAQPGSQGVGASPTRRQTLREQMYEGDFRARDRLEATSPDFGQMSADPSR
jgi:plasmid stability protein